MSHFDKAFDDLLANEGGYSDNPHDPGGRTMYGITEDVARAEGYKGDMRMLSKQSAQAIYRRLYWADWFDDLPYQVAFALFDTAVNSGTGQAARILQRTLGVAVDGVVGPKTKEVMQQVEPMALFIRYNAARLEFLAGLPNWQHFGRGWALRIVNNLRKGAMT